MLGFQNNKMYHKAELYYIFTTNRTSDNSTLLVKSSRFQPIAIVLTFFFLEKKSEKNITAFTGMGCFFFLIIKKRKKQGSAWCVTTSGHAYKANSR